jgi:hypothetical protein
MIDDKWVASRILRFSNKYGSNSLYLFSNESNSDIAHFNRFLPIGGEIPVVIYKDQDYVIILTTRRILEYSKGSISEISYRDISSVGARSMKSHNPEDLGLIIERIGMDKIVLEVKKSDQIPVIYNVIRFLAERDAIT